MLMHFRSNFSWVIPGVMSSLLFIAACSQSQPENIQSDLGKEIILGKTDQLLLSESIVSKENYLKLGLRGPEFPHDHIRNNALREVALIFGSQTGFKSATGSITRALEKHSNNLSVVFDFGKVTTPLEQNRGYVIPPVIIKATDAVSLNHEHTILSSTEHYLTIQKPGRLSTTIPTWRDYLLFPSVKIESIPFGLVPNNNEESGYFTHWFHVGWESGTDQAASEFENRLRYLKQDYVGMHDYFTLINQGLVNQLALVDADLGIIEDQDTLRINNRMVQIVSAASFQLNQQY